MQPCPSFYTTLASDRCWCCCPSHKQLTASLRNAQSCLTYVGGGGGMHNYNMGRLGGRVAFAAVQVAFLPLHIISTLYYSSLHELTLQRPLTVYSL
jgi:hypothetical protein